MGATATMETIRIEFRKYPSAPESAISAAFFIIEASERKNAKTADSTKHEDIIPNPLHSVATRYDAPSTFIAIWGSCPLIKNSCTVSLNLESTNADNFPAQTLNGRSKIFIANESIVKM